MRIRFNGIIVRDQDSALDFCTGVLGFAKKTGLAAGDFRWLTVVSTDDPDGAELAIEPDANPAAATYQKALFEAGIPLTAFEADDVESEHARLLGRGVKFSMKPTDVGTAIIAVFDDTCGNRIQLYQKK